MAAATIKAVSDFLRKEGETLKEFTAQWNTLSDAEKAQIREGIGNGTYTY